MKKIAVILATSLGTLAYSQNQINVVEKKTENPQRLSASEGTYQLIFKDESSKSWFFKKGILMASDFIGVGGITCYDDLLIVIHENRQLDNDQKITIGDNSEVTLYIPSLKKIENPNFEPLEEYTYNK